MNLEVTGTIDIAQPDIVEDEDVAKTSLEIDMEENLSLNRDDSNLDNNSADISLEISGAGCKADEIDIEENIDFESGTNVEAGIEFPELGDAEEVHGGDVDIDFKIEEPEIRVKADIKHSMPSVQQHVNVGIHGDPMVINEPKDSVDMHSHFSGLKLGSPDIHVFAEMDEIHKNANLRVKMPHTWSNNFEDRTEEAASGSVEFDGRREKLDVEIVLHINREALEQSVLYGYINSTKISGKRLVNCSEFEQQSDHSPWRPDFSFKWPKIHFPTLVFKSGTDDSGEIKIKETEVNGGDLEVDTPVKRHDFSFKWPKIELPTFSSKLRSSDREGEVDFEITGVRVEKNLSMPLPEEDIPVKRHDFSFKLPKVELPSFTFKSKSPNVDVDASLEVEGDVEVEPPVKRYDFSFKLPKVDLPTFAFKSKTDVDGDVDVKVSEVDVDVDAPSKRYDFNFKWPKVELPTFAFKSKTDVDGDVDVKVSEVDVDVDAPSKRYDFSFKWPKVDLPTFAFKSKSPDVDVDASLEVEGDVDVEAPSKRYDFSFKWPKVDLPTFNFKSKTDVEGDVDVKVSEVDVDVEAPSKRYDFSFKLPKVERPTFGFKSNTDVEGDVEVKVSEVDADADTPSKRYDFNFKWPKVELPTFPSWNKSPKVDGEVYFEDTGVRVQKDHSLDLAVDTTDSDTPVKRRDFSFKLSKVQFPTISFKSTAPNLDIRSGQADDDLELDITAERAQGNFSANVQEDDSDAKRHDFRFQLPKIKFPFFSLTKAAQIHLNSSSLALELGSGMWRYDFFFTFPDTLFHISSGKVVFDDVDVDTEKHQLSILFDAGDSSKTNIFKIELENGFLKCSECFSGEWLLETHDLLTCVSPEKNHLVVLLPIEDSELLVIFNNEMIQKYKLEGVINTLQSFNTEGSVKLIKAKLFKE